jgi:hypothetical protein
MTVLLSVLRKLELLCARIKHDLHGLSQWQDY